VNDHEHPHPGSLDALARELRALAVEPVPADVVARLDARLAAELATVPLAARRRRRLRLVPALGAAAAAAACVGVVAFAISSGGGGGDTAAVTAARSEAPAAAAESESFSTSAADAATTAAAVVPAAPAATGGQESRNAGKASPEPTSELGRVVVAATQSFELRVRENVAAACAIEGTACPAPARVS